MYYDVTLFNKNVWCFFFVLQIWVEYTSNCFVQHSSILPNTPTNIDKSQINNKLFILKALNFKTINLHLEMKKINLQLELFVQIKKTIIIVVSYIAGVSATQWPLLALHTVFPARYSGLRLNYET